MRPGSLEVCKEKFDFVIIVSFLDQAKHLELLPLANQLRKRHRTRKNKSKAMDTVFMDTFPQKEKIWAKVGPTDPTPMNQIITSKLWNE